MIITIIFAICYYNTQKYLLLNHYNKMITPERRVLRSFHIEFNLCFNSKESLKIQSKVINEEINFLFFIVLTGNSFFAVPVSTQSFIANKKMKLRIQQFNHICCKLNVLLEFFLEN